MSPSKLSTCTARLPTTLTLNLRQQVTRTRPLPRGTDYQAPRPSRLIDSVWNAQRSSSNQVTGEPRWRILRMASISTPTMRLSSASETSGGTFSKIQSLQVELRCSKECRHVCRKKYRRLLLLTLPQKSSPQPIENTARGSAELFSPLWTPLRACSLRGLSMKRRAMLVSSIANASDLKRLIVLNFNSFIKSRLRVFFTI